MSKLIDFFSYPVSEVLPDLLMDRTTGKHILFATDDYEGYSKTDEIPVDAVSVIKPRVAKDYEDQTSRTRGKGEVFTPSWLCNQMNNHCDSEWFGRDDVFNFQNQQAWKTNPQRIQFEKDVGWETYVNSKRIEITCGEAPYIVSRYDTTTGEIIPIDQRIGLLDRKLRVVNENTDQENDWLHWAYQAIKSVFGYEFQGDNLLIARVNILLTFTEYLTKKWCRRATKQELQNVVNIIVWNFWQMDGLSGQIPFSTPVVRNTQIDMFEELNNSREAEISKECVIYDWENNTQLLFKDLRG